ncbi:MAG: hypothetical protein ABFS43_02260 [Thermodesulfobacteriota bacterium]
MGKDSLIKSTSKKKNTSSKKDEDSANVKDKKAKAAKKTTTKAKKSTKAAPKKAKTTVKGKAASPAKAKAPKKSKTTAKSKTAAKTKTVAAKKAAEEKAVAEKAAAEKTAAEKAAAEKAAAEKAAAEKAAAEKAAAEKAAAEKAAAEKAAAEKAAAEKAAAEKAAAEKAEAERAAAEKAEAERAAQKPKPSISYAPPPDTAKPADTPNRPIQIAVGVFALLIFLIISASYMNKKQYHIRPVNGAIEVWQGNFAPKGTSLLVSLPGEKLNAPAKKVYSRQEVYPVIFNYYKEKAITLMDVKGMPDFETVKFYLEQALCYSTTTKEKADVNARISNIDFMVLMSKADAAMSKKTVASFETALQHLGQAAKLDLEDFQETQIKKKTEYAKQTLDQLKQEEAAAKAAAKKAQEASAAKKKAGAKKEDAKPKDVKTENAH